MELSLDPSMEQLWMVSQTAMWFRSRNSFFSSMEDGTSSFRRRAKSFHLSGGNSEAVKRVFFCESAFDAMAFYQMNRLQLSSDVALVSLGGTFSDGQITGVMQRFPQAKAYDCFDNDLAGRIYGLRMLALLEEIPMKINKNNEGIQVEAKGKRFVLNQDRSLTAQLSEHLNIRYRTGQWLPPKAFKDWNDCLLNKPMEQIVTPRKEEREQKLAERRNAGLKI